MLKNQKTFKKSKSTKNVKNAKNAKLSGQLSVLSYLLKNKSASLEISLKYKTQYYHSN